MADHGPRTATRPVFYREKWAQPPWDLELLKGTYVQVQLSNERGIRAPNFEFFGGSRGGFFENFRASRDGGSDRPISRAGLERRAVRQWCIPNSRRDRS